ncbi:MAG: hypothetical protein ACRC7R_01360 [Sarcina sp.]
MSRTPYLDLNIPDKSSKGFVVTDVFEPNFTKLDQEAERLNLRKMSTEDNVEELKKTNRYKLGDIVEVLGFYAKGDGSNHKRVAKAEDDGSGELGQNGIWWCVVHSGEVNVSWFGAKGDGVTDDTSAIQKTFVFGIDKTINIDKTHIIKNTLNLSENSSLNCTGLLKTGIAIGTVLNMSKDSSILRLNILCDYTASELITIDHDYMKENARQWLYNCNVNINNVTVFRSSNEPTQEGKSSFMLDNIIALKGGNNGMWGVNVRNINSYAFHNNFVTITSSKSNKGWITGCLFDKLFTCGCSTIINIRNTAKADVSSFVFSKIEMQVLNDTVAFPINLSDVTDVTISQVKFFDPKLNPFLVSNDYQMIRQSNCKLLKLYELQLSGESREAEWICLGKNSPESVRIDGQQLRELRKYNYLVSVPSFFGSDLTHISLYAIIKDKTSFWTTSLELPSDTGYYKYNLTMRNSVLEFTTDDPNSTFEFCYEEIEGFLFVYFKKLKRSPAWNIKEICHYTTSASETECLTICSRAWEYELNKNNWNMHSSKIFSNQTIINKRIDLTQLDTPYYTRKMEEEGMYDDYVAYRDELHEYENSQTGDDTMLLPALQEPIIPESVELFAKKYNLI